MRLYPNVTVKRQSYLNVKKCVVPNQSMSLREIVRRFVRRESLPISQNGLYEERFGDLEKLSKADITEQMDRVEQIKESIKSFEKRYKEQQEAAKKKAETPAPSSSPPTAVGDDPIKNPPPKGA